MQIHIGLKSLYFDLQQFKIDVCCKFSWPVQIAHIRKHVHLWCNCLPYTGSKGQAFFHSHCLGVTNCATKVIPTWPSSFYISMTLETEFLLSTASNCIVADYGLDDRGSILDRGRGFFVLSLRPGRLWGPPSPLSNGYRGSFPRG
jgi:hypothetical protein